MEKRRRLTPAERRAVYDKMGGRCAYCGEQLNYEDMQVDHVVALRSEGEDDLANMLPSCRSCNHYKRGNSLEGWRRILEAMPATLERDCILTVRLYGLVWLSQRQRKLHSTLKGGASE